MFKPISLAVAALAMGAGGFAPSVAEAQRYGDDRYERGYDARSYGDRYDRRQYRGDRRAYRENRQYRRCDNGHGGTVIGAIAGGLLGNSVAGRGDRTLGTVLGAVGGGLAGRAIDRSDSPRRCR